MSSLQVDLKLNWCSHEAAAYAVEHWHYSQHMPSGKLVKIGVWEDGQFIGAVIFGRGGNNHIGSIFSLAQTEICELVRVALWKHKTPVSRICTVAVRMLKQQSPGVRMLISYADPKESHHGGIYQAMNWTYVGTSTPQRELCVEGEFLHKRSASAKWGTAAPERLRRMTGLQIEYGPIEYKHAYYYPLDSDLRAKLLPLAQPYPKRARSIQDASAVQAEEGGAAPTLALQE